MEVQLPANLAAIYLIELSFVCGKFKGTIWYGQEAISTICYVSLAFLDYGIYCTSLDIRVRTLHKGKAM